MLRARITTAIISLVILGAVLFVVPAPAAKLLIALIILVGAWEWSGFLALQQNAGRYAFVALIAVLMAGMIFLLPEKTHLLMQVACIWWIVAFVWTFVFPTPIPIPVLKEEC